MLKFTVDGQKLELLGDPFVVADSFDFLTGSFKFYSGHDWDLTEKHVFFQLGEATPYEVTLTDDEFVKTDHVNLTTGVWSIYVIGYDIDGATLVERITTNKVSLTAQISGVPEGEPFPPSIIPDVLIVKDQTTPQTFINGVPRLAADRVIDSDNEVVDKKFVDDAVATVTADDFAHNSLSTLQGGSATERYHMTQAENAALHAHSNKTALDAVAGVNTGDQAASSFNHNDLANKQGGTTNEFYHVTAAEKTVIENTSGTNTGDQVLPTRDSLGLDTDDTVTFANLSGTNTGDQDVSGAISTHNADEGAHVELFNVIRRLDFPSIIFMGDSVTQQNGGFNSATSLYWQPNGFFAWTQLLSSGHFQVVRNAGIGGNTTTQMLARFSTDVMAYDSDTIMIMGGVNDVTDVGIPTSTTIANLLSMYETTRGDGRRLIISTITPSSTFDTDAKCVKLNEINSFVRSYAQSNKDVLFCDFFSAVVSETGRNWISILSNDGTHPNVLGAKRMGTKLYNVLSAALNLSGENMLSKEYLGSNNIITNGILTGDVSGKATGWTVTGGTATKNVYSGDYETYNEQCIETASVASPTMYRDLTTGIPVGQKVEGLVRIKFESLTQIEQAHMYVQYKTDGSFTALAYSVLGAFDGGGSYMPTEIIHTTPQVVIPAGTTALRIYLIAKNMIGKVKFSQPTLRIVSD